MKKLILVLLCISCTRSQAQEFDRARMDSLLHHIEKNEQGMGSLSIFQDGKEVYQKAVGYADVGEKVPATAETRYRIGSISKTVTATMIMQLVAEGKLSLETTLDRFFPEVGNAEKITIEHLLRHRSGIYNITNAQDYPSWMEQETSKDSLVRRIVSHGNTFSPGEKAEYSNSNYVLLTFIAEEVEGKPFSEMLQQRICKPCALNNTLYGSKISVEANDARSYTKEKEWVVSTETDMSIPRGAGALVSTPTDLNKFLSCLFNGPLTATVSLETMMKLVDGIGVGMFQVPFYEKRAYGHTGGIDGFQSNAFFFPKENVSVAYLSNGVSMALNNVMIGVLSIYFGRDYNFPEFTEAISVTSEELDKYLGVYSTPAFPLKITITKDANVLRGQATGQPSFPMECYGKDKFRFERAQLTMHFNPAENKMTFRQGGREFEMTRE